jgi:hypothetical protein
VGVWVMILTVINEIKVDSSDSCTEEEYLN